MRKTLFLLLCLITATLSAQDKKIAIKSASASSYQSGEDTYKAVDGDKGTIWHSSWSATSFPVTLTVTLSEVSHIDYLRYTPRQDGNVNGNWDEVTLSYAETTSSVKYTTIGSYKLNGAGSAYDFILPEGGIDCGKVRFTVNSGKNNFASAAEVEAFAYDNSKSEALAKYFEDDIFTILKPEVTSSEGIEDADAKRLVENILNNGDSYKKFRVGEYEAYLTTATLRNRLKVSSQYNNYENPSGVYLKKNESCIVMVSGIDNYPVGLTIKNWVKNEDASFYSLRNGFNYITASTEGNVFVHYYTDDYEKAPKVKIHFVNAPVQGYWDQETMTNGDWLQLLKGRAQNDSTILVTRSQHAQLAYPVFTWLQNCPSNIDSVMTLYQQVQWAERDILGLEKYGRQVKNRQLFYATTYGFMAAGGEGSYCHVNSLGGITKPDAAAFDFWGVGHEWGHNNQVSPGFKWTGCGETTNNIYAAWAQLHFTGKRHSLRLEDEVTGINDYSGMRGGRMQSYFEEALRKGSAWQLQEGPDYNGETPTAVSVAGEDANGKSIGTVNTTWRHYDHFVKLVPFWQLTLWGTLAQKCPDIVPMVIEAIRSDANYGTKYNTNGKQQVNWMKIACDSARIDLLPFFEKAGMLRPINAYVDDYTKGWNIITTAMIEELKSYVKGKGYPAFTEEINYINAHNFNIYRDNLSLETPATLGTGCSYSNGKVKVLHSAVKNAVAFETYNSADSLIRITMYGLGSDDAHSYTQVLYPGSSEGAEAAAYIVAVGYDGTRSRIYENTNIQKGLTANRYYCIKTSSNNMALSCGTGTSVNESGKITWNLARVSTKSGVKSYHIWQWKRRGNSYYLYNPQSGCYFSGNANQKTDELVDEAKAPAWEAACTNEEKSLFTFNIKGTGNYLNAYSETNTGLWTGGASDNNNIWKVEEVTSIKITIPTSQFLGACYPFAMELPEGVTAYVVGATATGSYNGAEYEYAVLEAIDSNIVPENMPVILAGENSTYTINIIPEDETEIAKTNLLKGTNLKKTMTKGSFLASITEAAEAGTTSAIGVASAATEIAINKSYLLKKDVANAERLYLDTNGSLTAIEPVASDSESPATLYSLDGKKVENPVRGRIYVTSEGKKILVK
ncbi:MAG: M60 family metallopeptidase [Bacteroidaceae bacterium]|nr:M60 family metallopeptidase [Bacteroidaceae bacterium]